MIKILDFNHNHIEEASKIALSNYNAERGFVPALPLAENTPDLTDFAANGLGAAMFDGGKMLGFLCCYEPWEGAFGTPAKGTFSPVHAHGAVPEKRERIYQNLYQTAAEKWVGNKITYHAIGLYAHDDEAINAFFTYGFGQRCADGIMSLDNFDCAPCGGIVFSELEAAQKIKIREMRTRLSEHMGESPCFMYTAPEEIQQRISQAEKRDTTRVFAAMNKDKPVAFIEIKDGGETFAAETTGMKNICGAFCLPEHRGKGIAQGLLNYVISTLRTEGYIGLGVDFESFNPTANGFWLKYFTAYTTSVVRRIDEGALKRKREKMLKP